MLAEPIDCLWGRGGVGSVCDVALTYGNCNTTAVLCPPVWSPATLCNTCVAAEARVGGVFGFRAGAIGLVLVVAKLSYLHVLARVFVVVLCVPWRSGRAPAHRHQHQ